LPLKPEALAIQKARAAEQGSDPNVHCMPRGAPRIPVDPNPTWNGYSVGHWEKDTLVIETIGFKDGLWLDANGNPLDNTWKVEGSRGLDMPTTASSPFGWCF
jgi:hypothetical protein